MSEQPSQGPLGRFFERYGRLLWWMHSLYALGLGVSVIVFAARGFRHARWLTLSLALAWLVLVLFFRIHGSGESRRPVVGAGQKLRFYVMTYLLKNMYQGMLFFLLPFYWRSATLGASNQWFVVALGACAFLATLDLVFDRVLMRHKLGASLFYLFTLFACANLIIPAALPATRPHSALLASAAIAGVAFASIHVRPAALFRPLGLAALVCGCACLVGVAHLARVWVPPASMWLEHAAAGPRRLADGRLAIETRRITRDALEEMHVVTDVAVPVGMRAAMHHRWTLEGREISTTEAIAPEPTGTEDVVRLASQLGPRDEGWPASPVGRWRVDVSTSRGQLVGRVEFEIIE